MKTRNHIARAMLLLSLLGCSSAAVIAQPHGRGPHGPSEPGQRLDMRLEFMEDRLDLTEDQVEAVRDILENAHAEAMAWRTDHPDASQADSRSFREDHRAATDSLIREVLNEEQVKIYEELEERRGPHGRGMHGGRHGKGMGARLDLDETQRARLESIHETLREDARAWRSEHPEATWAERAKFRAEHRAKRIELMSEVLSEAQMDTLTMTVHHGRHARRAAGDFARAFHGLNLSDEQEEAIREVLTDEQRSKLDRMLTHAGRGMHDGRGGRGPGMHEGRGAGGPGMLLNQLDLTEEQESRLKALRENHRAAGRAWHEANPNATMEERRAFRDAHREGMKAMISSILTDEQKEQLEALRADRPMGGHRGNRDK